MKFCVNAALSLVSDPGVLCTDFCRAALLRSCLSINLCPDESEIRHNLLHVLDVGLVKNRGLTQISLPLGGLLGQDVALISFEPLDLAGAGHFETLSKKCMESLISAFSFVSVQSRARICERDTAPVLRISFP